MTASSFPDFITARRRELELTLGDVAARLGVSPITVSNWSNGNAKPKTENLVALAELLEVPPDELADMAGVTLKSSASEGVNLMPAAEVEVDDKAPTEETDISEPIAEIHLAEPALVDDAPEEVEGVADVEDEVPIPEMSDDETAEPDTPDEGIADVEDEVPIPEMSDDETAEPATPDEEIAERETETGKIELVEEAEEAPDSVPALVATAATAEKAPVAKKRTGRRRPDRRAPAATERQVTTLPLTYIEDPKQLMRYRIRWALTVVVLAIMFFVLLWASRELLSALSEVKQAVTPGGIGG